jgi:hypothetical protein
MTSCRECRSIAGTTVPAPASASYPPFSDCPTSSAVRPDLPYLHYPLHDAPYPSSYDLNRLASMQYCRTL